ncbi:MAG: hypothetical protein B9S33_09100 [Pedosphaera sp. Tous-C6FEB]|nr:MAG: hypothetical protein B9S33_09100 [Pedosphaera sp. Tous-C6FEB]
MHTRTKLSLLWLTAGLVLPLALAAAEPGKSVSLFDGKTFKGWEGDTAKTFRIQDGAIVGGNLMDKVPRNEFLATTRQYTNFVLRLEFKLLGGPKANAGVQIRTQRIPNHHEVSGYQADMGDGWWGSLYDESRRNKVLAKADPQLTDKLVKRNEWNTYEIRCEGRRIRLAINGTQTVDYTEEDTKLPQFGIIAVQIHGGPPSEAWYRKITIEELP